MKWAVSVGAVCLITSFLGGGLAFSGCTDQTVDRPVGSSGEPGPTGDDASIASPDPDAAAATEASSTTPPQTCATTFGSAITNVFGRLDGVVRAVIVPGDPKCKSDNDHVIIQVDVDGATYKVWINVESSLTPNDAQVRMGEKNAALIGGAWSEGWHPNVTTLDYATSLNAHTSSGFQSLSIEDLGKRIIAAVKPGAKVAVFLEGFMTADGGHKVHRNSNNKDGALIVDPTGSPKWLLFHFSSQNF